MLKTISCMEVGDASQSLSWQGTGWGWLYVAKVTFCAVVPEGNTEITALRLCFLLSPLVLPRSLVFLSQVEGRDFQLQAQGTHVSNVRSYASAARCGLLPPPSLASGELRCLQYQLLRRHSTAYHLSQLTWAMISGLLRLISASPPSMKSRRNAGTLNCRFCLFLSAFSRCHQAWPFSWRVLVLLF